MAYGFGRMVKKQAIAAVERIGAAPSISVTMAELDEYAAVLCMFFNSTRNIETLLGLRAEDDGSQEPVNDSKPTIDVDGVTRKKLKHLGTGLILPVVIVALEGCHGCGKTALCEEFEAQGYDILDEAFMNMPVYALHPQSLLMETSWVCSWFERVLRLAARVKSGRKQVFIADRSPFSAVFYSVHGHMLEPIIREQMKEVQEFANVQFYTVHVQLERELLWRRICARLQVEPELLRLNEHKREWMEETVAFYENFAWDLTVTNDERSVATITNVTSQLLRERDDTFEAVYKSPQPRSTSPSSLSNSSTLSTDSECESVEESGNAETDALSKENVTGTLMNSIIAFNNTPRAKTF